MPFILRNADIPTIYKAFQALDGRPVPVEVDTDDGKKRTLIHTQPYSFSGPARLQIAKWLQVLKTSNETLSKAHDQLVRQFSEAPKFDKVPDDKMDAFRTEWLKVQEESQQFEQAPVKLADLKIEDNKLPGTIVAVLLPLLVE